MHHKQRNYLRALRSVKRGGTTLVNRYQEQIDKSIGRIASWELRLDGTNPVITVDPDTKEPLNDGKDHIHERLPKMIADERQVCEALVDKQLVFKNGVEIVEQLIKDTGLIVN